MSEEPEVSDDRDLQACICGAGYDLDSIYDDLVGVHEISERLGVSENRVRRWIERQETTGSPKPVLRRKLGPLYSMSHWRGWFALWRITRGSETWSRKTTGGL
jgi:hypothetical protein